MNNPRPQLVRVRTWTSLWTGLAALATLWGCGAGEMEGGSAKGSLSLDGKSFPIRHSYAFTKPGPAGGQDHETTVVLTDRPAPAEAFANTAAVTDTLFGLVRKEQMNGFELVLDAKHKLVSVKLYLPKTLGSGASTDFQLELASFENGTVAGSVFTPRTVLIFGSSVNFEVDFQAPILKVPAPAAAAPAKASGKPESSEDLVFRALAHNREKNYAEAAKLFRQACEAGEPGGCDELAKLYQQGRGVEKDLGQAVELWRRVCQDQAGSEVYRSMVCGQVKAGEAILKLQQTCQGGSAEDCYSLGAASQDGQAMAPGTEESDYRVGMVKAREAYLQACDGGLAKGCFKAGTLLDDINVPGHDYAKAAAIYAKACEAAHEEACAKLSLMYVMRRGMEQDREKYAEILRKACAAGLGAAC